MASDNCGNPVTGLYLWGACYNAEINLEFGRNAYNSFKGAGKEKCIRDAQKGRIINRGVRMASAIRGGVRVLRSRDDRPEPERDELICL